MIILRHSYGTELEPENTLDDLSQRLTGSITTCKARETSSILFVVGPTLQIGRIFFWWNVQSPSESDAGGVVVGRTRLQSYGWGGWRLEGCGIFWARSKDFLVGGFYLRMYVLPIYLSIYQTDYLIDYVIDYRIDMNWLSKWLSNWLSN